jgi:uncharacterized integral membrane protein (TIGR00697 family)
VNDLSDRRMIALVTLTSLFVASLTASNFLAAKLFSIRLGGLLLAAPAAVAAYALTFTFTDIIGEVFGKKAANMAVRLGFASQLLVLGYIIIAVNLPTAPFSPVSEEAYESVIYSGKYIILASLTAYLISQHHDVWAFHLWKEKTSGRWLWLRNNASTIVSQLLDTVIFISLAFNILPRLFIGQYLPWTQIGSIILGQYLVKVLIALMDTPLVYAAVALNRNYIEGVQTSLQGVTTTLQPTRVEK